MKALILDLTHKVLLDCLSEAGIELCLHPEYEREDLMKEIHNYEALVVRSKLQIDKTIIDAGTRLRCIARTGAGMDTIDVQYAQSKSIQCLNSPEGNRTAVGEHALGMLLCLFNKIALGNKEVKEWQWNREKNRGLEVEGKTIGIIGYGNMGGSFAKHLCGFDCTVLAYDKYKKDYSDSYACEASLEEIFAKADILSLHVPLTEETRSMVNYEFLSRFAKHLYLINTSRGKVVATHDLVRAMKEGKVAGCCLDVLEQEKFSSELEDAKNEDLSYLFSVPNTVLTPHVAGWSVESYYKLAYFLGKKIVDCLCK